MSRNFLPAVLAIGVGVFTGTISIDTQLPSVDRAALTAPILLLSDTGYYTFQPAFQQLEFEKANARQSSLSKQDANASSQPSASSQSQAQAAAAGSKPGAEN
ncbi:hypothetical protein NUU61_003145 [Penicillium alfredii]|uniref:Uncharacterized protein n=1 Tax=Penicillium alfredii TaxID=1506179 RepID=A0A9W9FT01_9EURO|nr:uncharacterized protein NUU61_003145 [Penicillium alfredii]KAJ5105798.1 hypothetical protein NUU61_003145 [Penicillium alfredii]